MRDNRFPGCFSDRNAAAEKKRQLRSTCCSSHVSCIGSFSGPFHYSSGETLPFIHRVVPGATRRSLHSGESKQLRTKEGPLLGKRTCGAQRNRSACPASAAACLPACCRWMRANRKIQQEQKPAGLISGQGKRLLDLIWNSCL